ncbi:MAG: tripartite tricarboxylate transporter substrate binding protein [bacterium]|nr:tripartite tricarboxylate transporter substrate binding protein [bacterium]
MATTGRLLVALLIVGYLGCTRRADRTAECIAPANPGGGWDMTCRSVARVLPQRMRVTNMPGAGGGAAFANLVARRSTDDHTIVAASAGTTLRLAQKQFGRFSESDVRWLAAVAADYGTLVVRTDSRWRDLPQFIDEWKADPSALVFGGGSTVGGQDHVKMLLLARAAGIDPMAVRYVPFDGGGEAMTALLGGFLDAMPADTSEAVPRLEAGVARVLAVLHNQRLPGALSDTPTARELGFDAEWLVWRGFYAPGGMSEQAYSRWSRDLETLAASPQWKQFCDRAGLYPLSVAGADFERYVAGEMQRFRQLTAELGMAQ